MAKNNFQKLVSSISPAMSKFFALCKFEKVIGKADPNATVKDYITVTIKEADGTVLCKGTMSELSSDKVAVSSLAAGEKKTLTIEFYFSSEAGNAAQGQSVSFNITANATQKQNNPNKDFGN